MEGKGVVKKMFNEEEGGSDELFLREKGEEMKKEIVPVVMDGDGSVRNELRDEEVEELKLVLKKLLD